MCIGCQSVNRKKRTRNPLQRRPRRNFNNLNKALDNDFIGNVIDVCPVGALTDRTARFASRVWFTKPYNATCKCTKCSGKAVLWMKGDEVVRVTARKDQYGEVEDLSVTNVVSRKKILHFGISKDRDISTDIL
jgi:NADH-quinone oxidoreductase subunit G